MFIRYINLNIDVDQFSKTSAGVNGNFSSWRPVCRRGSPANLNLESLRVEALILNEPATFLHDARTLKNGFVLVKTA